MKLLLCMVFRCWLVSCAVCIRDPHRFASFCLTSLRFASLHFASLRFGRVGGQKEENEGEKEKGWETEKERGKKIPKQM